VFLIGGIIQARKKGGEDATPKLLSGYSQMGAASDFHPWDMFVPRRSRFDRVGVRSHFLHRRIQNFRKLVWE
jgi:hypothetical protein